MKSISLVLLATLALAACDASSTGSLAANELSVNYEGDNFAGIAGAGWSDEDLRDNAFGAVCGDRNVTAISITRNSSGGAEFTGTCSV